GGMRTPLLLALLACPCAAAWIGIDAGPVKAYSDSGERGLRQILARLELAARVAGRPNPLPVRVFLLSSGRFAAVRPGATTRGFYQGGPSRDSIVLPAGGDARVAVHEYTHMTLHHTAGPLPKWL